MYFQSIENLYLGVMYAKEDIIYAQWVHPFFLKDLPWYTPFTVRFVVSTGTRHSAVHL